MKLFPLRWVLLTFALIAPTTAAEAQGAWCAQSQGGTSCGFSTFAQCQATISGVGGFCRQNPYGPAAANRGAVPFRVGAREDQRNWRKALAERRKKMLQEAMRARMAKQPASRAPVAAAAPAAARTGPAAAAASSVNISELDVAAIPSLNREGIRKVQLVLKEKGFDPGAPNGIATPRMKNAVRGFQERFGINATGEVDNQTLLALGQAELASQ